MIVEGPRSVGDFSVRRDVTSITSYPGRMGSSVGIAVSLALALALGACDSGGMEIVVYGPADGATPAPFRVKLYIGLGAAQDASLVTAPNKGVRFAGKRWDRDPSNLDDSTEYGDGPARFVFRKGGDIDRFGAVIAVGYAEDGTPTSSALLLDPEMGTAHVRVYKIGLNAITDPHTKRGGYNALALWGPASKSTPDDSCVFTQNTYPDPTSSSAFIVTPGDRDCDGFEDSRMPPDPRECVDDVWLGKRTATRNETSCLALGPPGMDGTLAPTCLLGGPACIDGVGMDASCTPNRYCAPEGLCSNLVCGTGPGAWDCAKDVLTSPNLPLGQSPTIVCSVFYKAPNGASVATVCPEAGTFDLRAVALPASSTTKCGGVQIRNRTQGFQSELVEGAVNLAVDVGDTCALTLTPSGTFPMLTGLPPAIGGLLAVDMQGPGHGFVYPIKFEFELAQQGQCAPPDCRIFGPTAIGLPTCVATPAPL